MKTTIYTTEIDSPLGAIRLAGTSKGLCGLWFHDQRYFPQDMTAWQSEKSPFKEITQWLESYFKGQRPELELPMDFVSGTPFQQQVWQALLRIPLGETCTYGHLAALLDRPTASRAVGAAVGRNPLSIIVPCHRVVGSNQSLTGYAGGLDRKRWLLDHERRMLES